MPTTGARQVAIHQASLQSTIDRATLIHFPPITCEQEVDFLTLLGLLLPFLVVGLPVLFKGNMLSGHKEKKRDSRAWKEQGKEGNSVLQPSVVYFQGLFSSGDPTCLFGGSSAPRRHASGGEGGGAAGGKQHFTCPCPPKWALGT